MTQENYDKLLFTSYQHSYIFAKAILLKGVINNPTEIMDLIQENRHPKFSNYEAVVSDLKAEIHFSMYHALESMFAMIFALIKQPDNVWIWLTNYNFSKFNKMIAKVAESNISSISERDELETIQTLFFKHCPEEFLEQVQTKNAIKNISKILILCAREMIDKSEYNSYKHGLRLISGDLKLKLVNEKETTEKTIDIVPGFVYLDTKNKNSIKKVPKEYSKFKFKFLSVELLYNSIFLNLDQI